MIHNHKSLHKTALIRSVLLLFLPVVLSGCSLFSLFYNNLETFLTFELKRIITLSQAQEKQVLPVIKRVLKWHRQQRLPQYIEWIDEYKIRVNSGFKQQDADWIQGLIKMEFRELWAILSTELSPLTTSIKPRQIEELQYYFQNKNQTYQERLTLTREQYDQQRLDKLIERMEDWLGQLSDKQIKIFEQSVRQLKDDRKPYLDFRIHKQQQWATLLKARLQGGEYASLSAPKFALQMQKLTQRIANQDDPRDYLTLNAMNAEITKKSVTKVMQMMTEPQRTHLLEEVEFYREELLELMDQS